MAIQEIPIVCTLTGEAVREQRRTLLHRAGEAVQEVQEREQGYAYRFPSEMLETVAHIIALEHQCCAFMRFTLTLEPGDGPLWLEITGPEGTKDFLASFWR